MQGTKKKEVRNPVTRAAWLAGQVGVQLRMPREMEQAMRQRAQQEAMSLASWIRIAAIKELRRKKAA